MIKHIHDVMVRPEYQGMGIGTGIMNNILDEVNVYRDVNPGIRVYLGVSKGKKAFYKKFSFVNRPNERWVLECFLRLTI